MKCKRLFSILVAVTLLMSGSAYAAEQQWFLSVGSEQPGVARKLEQLIVFRADHHEAIIRNHRYDIQAEDLRVQPFIQTEGIYIPLSFTVKHMGGVSTEANGTADVSLNGVSIKIENDKIPNGAKNLAVKSYKKLFVTAEDFSTLFGVPVKRYEDFVVLGVNGKDLPDITESDVADWKSFMSYEWSNVFLGSLGYVTGIYSHPLDDNALFCRTDVGGSYRYNYEYDKWVCITDTMTGYEMGTDNMINLGMAIDPTDIDTIYLATKTGLMKTTDGGVTWRKLNINVSLTDDQNRLYGEPIAVDPHSPNLVYFGTDGDGIKVSRDGGETWTKASGVPDQTLYGIRCIVFDNDKVNDKGETVVYAGVSGHGVYKSEDGGRSFSKMPDSPVFQGRMQCVDGSIYVGMSSRVNSMNDKGTVIKTDMPNGLYVFRNGEWEDITPPQSSVRDFTAMAVKEDDPNFIIAVQTPYLGSDMFRSTDGGKNWKSLGKLKNYCSLVFNRANPNELYMAFGAGIEKIKDVTADNIEIVTDDTGVEELCNEVLVSIPGAKTRLFSGNLDWGFFGNRELAERAERIGNPLVPDVQAMDYCGQDPSITVMSASSINFGGGSIVIELSRDYGETWERVNTWSASNLVANVAVGAEPLDNGLPIIMFRAITGNDAGVYVSRDAMQTWEKLDLPALSANRWDSGNLHLISDKVNGKVFYYIYNNSIYVTWDGGVTWKFVNSVPDKTVGGKNLIWEASPTHEGRLAYCGASGIMVSEDYGYTWKKTNDLIYAEQVSFGKGPDDNTDALYACGKTTSQQGVFRSTDMGETWMCVSDPANKMPQRVILYMCGDKNVFGRVYVGTSGRGVLVGSPYDLHDELPVIEVTTELPEITADNTVKIEGTVSQPSEVRINNVPADVNGDLEFSGEIPLQEGKNTIRIEAVANDKYTATPVYRYIEYVPGYVGLTLNRDENYTVTTSSVVIAGSSTEPGKVTVNNQVIELDAEKNFALEVQLTEGANEFTIIAEDEQGNRSEEKKLCITKDTTSPTYTFGEVPESVNQPYYILKSTMNEDGEFRINGRVVNASKDVPLEYFVSLKSGVNDITVEARDLSGNVSKPTELKVNSEALPMNTSQLTAGYISPSDIKIDGVLNEDFWQDKYLMTKTITGVANNVAYFDLYWNEDYLYFGARVNDSKLVFNSSAVHEDDSIEVYLDADNCHGEKYCAHTRQMQFRADSEVYPTGTICKSAVTDFGYTMEIAIPWSVLAASVKEGMTVGFDAACNDDDGLLLTGGRSSVLSWHNTVDENYITPKNYAYLTLIKESE